MYSNNMSPSLPFLARNEKAKRVIFFNGAKDCLEGRVDFSDLTATGNRLNQIAHAVQFCFQLGFFDGVIDRIENDTNQRQQDALDKPQQEQQDAD